MMNNDSIKADYKSVAKDHLNHVIGPFGHEISLKEIGACCGHQRGMVVTFFSKLFVFVTKGIWLNEKTVNQFLDLEHFDKMAKTVAKIELARDNIDLSKAQNNRFPASTLKQHKFILKTNADLETMNRRLGRIRNIYIQAMNRKPPEDKVKQPGVIAPNQSWSLNDLPVVPSSSQTEPVPFPGLPVADKLADQAIVQENNQLFDLVKEGSELLGDIAMNHVNKEIGVTLPQIFKETVSSAIDLRGITTTGLTNLLDYVKINLMADTKGKNVLNNLPDEYKAKIQEYINLLVLVQNIKNSVVHPLKGKMDDLEKRIKSYDTFIEHIKPYIENDRIGAKVPQARDAAVSVADRYFSVLAQATKALRVANSGFNDIPSNIRQYMILTEMKRINELAPENEKIKTPFFVPTLDESEKSIVQDLLKKINGYTDTHGKVIAGIKPRDFNDDDIVLLGGMDQEIGLKFKASDPSIDKAMGSLGNEAMEKLLFPHGIPLGNTAEWALKLAGKNFEKMKADQLNITMKAALNNATKPFNINRMLERMLDKAIAKYSDITALNSEITKTETEIQKLKESQSKDPIEYKKKNGNFQLKELEEHLNKLNKAVETKHEIVKIKDEIEKANQKFNFFDDVLSTFFDLDAYNKNLEHIEILNFKLAVLEGRFPENANDLFYNRIRENSPNQTQGMGNPEMTDKYAHIGLNLASLVIPEGNLYERQFLKDAENALNNKPENRSKIQKMVEQPLNDLAMKFDNKMLIELIEMGMKELQDENGVLNLEYFAEDGTLKENLPNAEKEQLQLERIKTKIDLLTSVGINIASENILLKPFLSSPSVQNMITEHRDNLYNILTLSEVNKVLVAEMITSLLQVA